MGITTEYQQLIEEVKNKIKKNQLPSLPTKGDKKDYEEKRIELSKELEKIKKYAAIYSQFQVGCGVSIGDRCGVIVDRMVNVGGIPQAWICWGCVDIPYPEYPSIYGELDIEIFPACCLSEVSQIQEKEAA